MKRARPERQPPPPIRLPLAPVPPASASATVLTHPLSARPNRQRRTPAMLLGVDDSDNVHECARLIEEAGRAEYSIAHSAFERVVRATLELVQPAGEQPFQLSRNAVTVLRQASEERLCDALYRANVVAHSRRLSTRDAEHKVACIDERDFRLGEWLARRDDVRRHEARGHSEEMDEDAHLEEDALELAYYRRARATQQEAPSAAERCAARPSDKEAVRKLRGCGTDDEEEEEEASL